MTIISPWVFYLIGVLNSTKYLLDGLQVMAIVYFIVIVLVAFIEWDFEILEKCKLKLVLIITIVLSIINIVIPSQETMYTMLVASQVTTENLEVASDVIQDSVDYILEQFNEGDDKE